MIAWSGYRSRLSSSIRTTCAACAVFFLSIPLPLSLVDAVLGGVSLVRVGGEAAHFESGGRGDVGVGGGGDEESVANRCRFVESGNNSVVDWL